MTEFITGFFQTNILINITYIFILAIGIYYSIKDNVSPVQTLLLILTGTLIYFTVTNLVRLNIFSQLSDENSFTNLIVLLGVLAVFTGVYITKNILRISLTFLLNLPLLILIALAIYETSSYLNESNALSTYDSYNNLSTPVFSELGLYINQSALISPELSLYNHLFLSIVVAVILVTLLWFAYKKIKIVGNKLLFTVFIINLFIFINMFNFNPGAFPAFNNRIIGMNVFQWGIILINILIIAYIIAKEIGNAGSAHRLKRNNPSYFLLFFYYLCLTVAAFPLSGFFDSTGLHIFIAGHAITTIFMAFYFFVKTEKAYVRLGTISVILLIWMFFIRANISFNTPSFIDSPETETMHIDNKF